MNTRIHTLKNAIPYVILWILCFCTIFKQEVYATSSYQVTEQNGILQCTYEGEQQLNQYLPVQSTDNGYEVVKPGTPQSRIYFFDGTGEGLPYEGNHFIQITYENEKATYYSKCGILQKNAIVGNEEEGYFYVDTTGQKITSKEIKEAVKFVRAHTKKDGHRVKN